MPTAKQLLHKAVPRLAKGDEKAKKLERKLLKLALHVWGKGPDRLKKLGVVVSERTWSKVDPDPATFWNDALKALEAKRFYRMCQALKIELKARLERADGSSSGRTSSRSSSSRSRSGSRRSSGRAEEPTSPRSVKRRRRRPEEETAPRAVKRKRAPEPEPELALPESGDDLAIPGSGVDLAIPESGEDLVVPGSDMGGVPDVPDLDNLELEIDTAPPTTSSGGIRFGDDDAPADAEDSDPTAAAERALGRYRESGDADELQEARRLYKLASKEAQGKIPQGVARAGLAQTYLLAGQREKAHEHAKKALSLFPGEPTAVAVWVSSEREASAARAQVEALLARANTLIQREQAKEVATVAKQIKKLAPESALPGLLKLAVAVESMVDGDALEPIIASAWKTYPGDPEWADMPLGTSVENAIVRGVLGWLRPRWEGEGAPVLKQAVQNVEDKKNLIAGAWQLSLGVARVALSTRRRPSAEDQQQLTMWVGHALFFAQYYDHAKEVYGAARKLERGGPFVGEINKQETQCGVMRRGFDRPGVKAKMGQLTGVGLAAYRKALGQRLEQAIRERDKLQQKISADLQKIVGGIVAAPQRRKVIAKNAKANDLADPFARLEEVEEQLKSISKELAAKGDKAPVAAAAAPAKKGGMFGRMKKGLAAAAAKAKTAAKGAELALRKGVATSRRNEALKALGATLRDRPDRGWGDKQLDSFLAKFDLLDAKLDYLDEEAERLRTRVGKLSGI